MTGYRVLSNLQRVVIGLFAHMSSCLTVKELLCPILQYPDHLLFRKSFSGANRRAFKTAQDVEGHKRAAIT
jgi:hypothetical protein